MTAQPPPSGSRGSEARDAVEAVLRDQQDRARKRDVEAPPPRDRGPLLLALAAVLLGLIVWFAVAPPAALLPPPFPEPEPVEIEAGLRMEVFVAATAVARHRQATGRLPASLGEILEDADDTTAVRFQALDGGRWRIVGRRGDFEVVYTSTEDRNSILDPARAVLERSR